MLSAGEASGDRLGAGLARALRERCPDIELLGMGGDEMAAAGVRLVRHASEVAVVGFLEVVSHLPAIRRAMADLEGCLERERPDLLVPIDFPDFNFSLARRARRVGVEVVYFVSPQVWAWRRGRVRTLRRLVRRMLVLFPFEARFYEEAGVPVTFVGHPVVERIPREVDRDEVLRRAALDPARRTVALLPGSRVGEVSRLIPPMAGAAKSLRRERPDLQFVVPAAGTLPRGLLERLVAEQGIEGVEVRAGSYPEILLAADAGVVASGTASLESAVAGLPIVVAYRMQPLSYLLGRLLVRVDHIAMPNLVLGRRVVPELVQGACTADRIAEQLGIYLDRPEEASRVREELGRVRGLLGGPGALTATADAILEEVGRPGVTGSPS